jgi:hypothetical protein
VDVVAYYKDFIKGIILRTQGAIPDVLDRAFENILQEAQPIIIQYYDNFRYSLKIAQDHVYQDSVSRDSSLDMCEKYLHYLEQMKATSDMVSVRVNELIVRKS